MLIGVAKTAWTANQSPPQNWTGDRNRPGPLRDEGKGMKEKMRGKEGKRTEVRCEEGEERRKAREKKAEESSLNKKGKKEKKKKKKRTNSVESASFFLLSFF